MPDQAASVIVLAEALLMAVPSKVPITPVPVTFTASTLPPVATSAVPPVVSNDPETSSAPPVLANRRPALAGPVPRRRSRYRQ